MKRIAVILVALMVLVMGMGMGLSISADVGNTTLADIFDNKTKSISEINDIYNTDNSNNFVCKYMIKLSTNSYAVVYLRENDILNIDLDSRLLNTNGSYYYLINTQYNVSGLYYISSSNFFNLFYMDKLYNFIYATDNVYISNYNLTFYKTLPITDNYDNATIWDNRPSYSQAKIDALANYDLDTCFMVSNSDGIYIYYYNQNDSVYSSRITSYDYTELSNSTLQLQATGTNESLSNRCVVYTVDPYTLTYSPVSIEVTPVLYVIPNTAPSDILYASSNLFSPDGTVLFPRTPWTPAVMGETIRGLVQEQMLLQMMKTVQVIVITAVSCLVSLIALLLLPKVLRIFLKR